MATNKKLNKFEIYDEDGNLLWTTETVAGSSWTDFPGGKDEQLKQLDEKYEKVLANIVEQKPTDL